MKFFKNMSIRYKILVPVAILGVFLVSLAFASIRSSKSIMNASEEISANYLVRVELFGDISSSYQSLRNLAFANIVAEDVATRLKLHNEAIDLNKEIGAMCDEYENLLKTSAQKDAFAKFRSDYAVFMEYYDQTINFSELNLINKASAIANNELKEATNTLNAELDQMREQTKADMAAAEKHQEAAYRSAIILSIVLLVMGAVVFVFVVWVSWTWACKRLININKQLRGIISGIEAGQGDLTKRVQCFCTDEIGTLAAGINTFIETLQGIMGHINSSSGQLGSIVSLVSDKVSTANSNSYNISTVMEELSASMEEITSTLATIKGNVDVVDDNIIELSNASQQLNVYASEMSERAQKLQQNAIENKQTTSDVVSGIINKLQQAIESSKNVEQVNELTNEILTISSKTNLLSLNASIEAARAGEAGRGFAVVADEISQLANSSRETANNIQTINNMVIEAVRELVENADSMVQFINNNILPDYEEFVEAGKQYNDDSVQVNATVVRFNDMANNLKHLMQNITKAIDGINSAVDESANGTMNVAENTSDLVRDIGEIAEAMNDNRQVAGTLNGEAERFVNL